MRLYANGIEIGFLAVTGNIASVGAPFNLGGRADGFDFDGQVDEVEVFDNALLPEDIAKIYHAGSAGKCRPCTPAPSGMTDWWPGDSNANNIQGFHNGTFHGDAGISVGKVGNAFSFDGNGDYIDVGDVDLPGTFTIDAWINPDSLPVSRTAIIEKQGTFLSYALLVYNNGALEGYVSDGLQNAVYFTAPGTIVTGGWQHVAMTYDVAGSAGARILLYVNGANVATTPESDGAVTPGNEASSAKIGSDAFNDFDGLIDEVELFNRVLSSSEISGIYDAGQRRQMQAGDSVRAPAGEHLDARVSRHRRQRCHRRLYHPQRSTETRPYQRQYGADQAGDYSWNWSFASGQWHARGRAINESRARVAR